MFDTTMLPLIKYDEIKDADSFDKVYTWFSKGGDCIMPNSIESAKLPKYTNDAFVNRDKEMALVEEKAKALIQRQPLDERTIIFMGQRGTGKSWLIRHLQTRLAALPAIISLIIDLEDYRGSTPEEAVKKILYHLNDRIFKQSTLSTEELPELSREFMRHLRVILMEQPIAFLVDTVFESDWQLLATLERYLLGPLAAESRVMIVMAGRGQAYPWKTPELRLRAMFHNLEPFTPEQTKAQLARQKPKSVKLFFEIYERSGGNPLASFMLADRPESPDSGLDQAINELLKVIPDSVNRQQLRQNLEAISVLNAFDEEQIPTMLAAYYGEARYKDWKPTQARQVRENIVRCSFAQWDEKQKGYVLDSTLLRLLKRYLQTEERQELWQRLHCAAHQLYLEWAAQYRRTSERWRTEADFHQNELAKKGFSLEDCSYI